MKSTFVYRQRKPIAELMMIAKEDNTRDARRRFPKNFHDRILMKFVRQTHRSIQIMFYTIFIV